MSTGMMMKRITAAGLYALSSALPVFFFFVVLRTGYGDEVVNRLVLPWITLAGALSAGLAAFIVRGEWFLERKRSDWMGGLVEGVIVTVLAHILFGFVFSLLMIAFSAGNAGFNATQPMQALWRMFYTSGLSLMYLPGTALVGAATGALIQRRLG